MYPNLSPYQGHYSHQEPVDSIVVVLSLDGTVAHCNPFANNLLGLTEKQVQDRNWIENFIHPGCREKFRRLFRETASLGKTFHTHFNCRLRGPYQAAPNIRWKMTLLMDKGGKETGILLTGNEIKSSTSDNGGQKELSNNIELTGLRFLPGEISPTSESNDSLNYTSTVTTPISSAFPNQEAERKTEAEVFQPKKTLTRLYLDLAEYEKKTPAAGNHIPENESQYHGIFDLATEGMAIVNSFGRITEANRAFSRMSGYTREELYGSRADSYFGEGFSMEMEAACCEGTELEIIRKNRLNIWVKVLISPIGKDGDQLLSMTDITMQKNAEERLNCLSGEVDDLLYKVSHDLRGPSASIMGLLNIAKEDVLDPEALDYIHLLQGLSRKLDSSLEYLIRTFSLRKPLSRYKFIDFEEVLEKIKTNSCRLAGLMDGEIVLQGNVPADFFSDETLVEVVFQNLIENSIKFHDINNGSMCLEIQLEKAEGGINLKFKDNGIGILPCAQHRIFELYYKGHTNTNGGGIGLHVVKKAVETLKGNISLESEPGKGTCFSVFLPSADSNRPFEVMSGGGWDWN